jgi:hypothetical protein
LKGVLQFGRIFVDGIHLAVYDPAIRFQGRKECRALTKVVVMQLSPFFIFKVSNHRLAVALAPVWFGLVRTIT